MPRLRSLLTVPALVRETGHVEQVLSEQNSNGESWANATPNARLASIPSCETIVDMVKFSKVQVDGFDECEGGVV
jgi:hypothetical protein